MVYLKSVLIRAKQYLPTASGAEQGALRYLLEHSEEIPQLSVKELSQRSFSSAATIVRLCKKLGFEGYRDLQKQLLFEIAVRTQEQNKGNARVTAGSTSDIVYKITYRNIASLEETVKLVEPQVLEQAVDMICRADSVLLFGLGASQLVARRVSEIPPDRQALLLLRGHSLSVRHRPEFQTKRRGDCHQLFG